MHDSLIIGVRAEPGYVIIRPGGVAFSVGSHLRRQIQLCFGS